MASRDPNKRGRGNTLPGMEEEGAEFIGKCHNLTRVIDSLDKKMREAAANLEFELAARLRDEAKKLRDVEIGLGVEKVMGSAD
jgi:excinuclease UvrABC nuclease subunit